MVIARKITLYPVGDKIEVDRVYKYLRDGMEAQNRAMNLYMNDLWVASQLELTKEEKKELNNIYGRISNSKKCSAYDKDIQFAKGLPIGAFTQKVRKDFSTAMKKGLQYGRTSLPFYRATNPLYIHRDYVRVRSTNPHSDFGLYYNYDNAEEFEKHLFNDDLEILIKFANDITFKVVLGNPHKSAELRSVFQKIFNDEYSVQGSSIEINSKGKIILNLSMEIPTKKIELDETISVGVDLGLAIPAYCAVNNNDYIKRSIGKYVDFERVRQQIKKQKQRLQKNLSKVKGGHGRKKKLATLEKLKERESNFVKTYNHFVSKNVVGFAVKNKAKYINVEDLSGFTEAHKKDIVLRDWSYYQLQEQVAYKAEKYGIIVRKVNPAYTSQTCSCCGHYEEGQREKQAEFICKNPECKNYGKVVNADFNAAKNISMSTEFTQIRKDSKWVDVKKEK